MPWEEGIPDLGKYEIPNRQTQWFDRAACATLFKLTGKDLWFKDDSNDNGRQPAAEVKLAKRICARCPVRAACLADAIEYGWEHGIWGGLTADERRKLSPLPKSA